MVFSSEYKTPGEPLYKQTADYLQKLILSGELQAGEQLPSEVDLAEQLGVSRLTLRKSLSILIAGGLIKQRPHCGTFVAGKTTKRLKIGILHYISDIEFTNFYGKEIMLQFCLLSTFYPDTEIVFLACPYKNRKAVAEMIEKSGCDGYIVPFGSYFFAEILDQERYDFLPIVYINKNDDYSGGKRFNVTLDDDPYREMMLYLKNCGHRKIAYISRELPYRHTQIRGQSFLKHAPPEADFVVKGSKLVWTEYARRETVRLCNAPEPPTVIVTPGSAFAAGVIQGLMESRMVIPEDISVVGFDYGGFLPAISTVDQPLYDMALKALSVVREVISGKVYRNHTFLYHSIFHDRGSIKKLTDL